jgi:hypothetical protein
LTLSTGTDWQWRERHCGAGTSYSCSSRSSNGFKRGIKRFNWSDQKGYGAAILGLGMPWHGLRQLGRDLRELERR